MAEILNGKRIGRQGKIRLGYSAALLEKFVTDRLAGQDAAFIR
ncbi:MAG: hypothetical protein WCE68_15650 [Anaerolineales bacterium]